MVLELAKHLHLNDQETRRLLEASLTALTPYWSVPLLRNPFFTGCEEVLEILHVRFASNQAIALPQSWALCGLGGVGKTQIALEYAYRHALEYSAVFWIGAEAEEQIISSMVRVAEILQLPVRNDKERGISSSLSPPIAQLFSIGQPVAFTPPLRWATSRRQLGQAGRLLRGAR